MNWISFMAGAGVVVGLILLAILWGTVLSPKVRKEVSERKLKSLEMYERRLNNVINKIKADIAVLEKCKNASDFSEHDRWILAGMITAKEMELTRKDMDMDELKSKMSEARL